MAIIIGIIIAIALSPLAIQIGESLYNVRAKKGRNQGNQHME